MGKRKEGFRPLCCHAFGLGFLSLPEELVTDPVIPDTLSHLLGGEGCHREVVPLSVLYDHVPLTTDLLNNHLLHCFVLLISGSCPLCDYILPYFLPVVNPF